MYANAFHGSIENAVKLEKAIVNIPSSVRVI
jgi:hypothetical protein